MLADCHAPSLSVFFLLLSNLRDLLYSLVEDNDLVQRVCGLMDIPEVVRVRRIAIDPLLAYDCPHCGRQIDPLERLGRAYRFPQL